MHRYQRWKRFLEDQETWKIRLELDGRSALYWKLILLVWMTSIFSAIKVALLIRLNELVCEEKTSDFTKHFGVAISLLNSKINHILYVCNAFGKSKLDHFVPLSFIFLQFILILAWNYSILFTKTVIIRSVFDKKICMKISHQHYYYPWIQQ